MIVWVMYDIKKDRARTKIAKICQQAGLYRVQYSVFLGTLEKNQFDSLHLQLEELMDEEKDSVYMFPMSKDELQQTVLLGQAFDKDFVTDEVRSLFF
ncbi:CRISPR-associated protein Cas2 [Aquiflexum balticum DSM 16537]|uniref:CRISPR-associated endoribonuclease Cas2 n=1 Tax=Aquiflexum balticum DSM 16537 TaxID=758820 RepID=A0A1W2H9H4_9BACT|nr:CRISPR-associated endonuclease Cas2 [Aquiflexum balticum]SMD45362.1 CRISPR-associated protein Cas2 [Aquiflexum balticum DSM 16537]